MRKLFLHVGFAKCGSTSLQAAFAKSPGVVYPLSGSNAGEHLALALSLRGIDEWTRQFFDEAWVAQGMAGIWSEIVACDLPVILSSERLAAMSSDQIERTAEIFRDFDVQIIFIKRDVVRYLNSTWRHAVFHHDYAEAYQVFCERTRKFSFFGGVAKFERFFPVHVFDMEDEGYITALSALVGTQLNLPRKNIGVPFDFAEHLQKTHALLGTEAFKARFDSATKRQMLRIWNGECVAELEPLRVPLF